MHAYAIPELMHFTEQFIESPLLFKLYAKLTYTLTLVCDNGVKQKLICMYSAFTSCTLWYMYNVHVLSTYLPIEIIDINLSISTLSHRQSTVNKRSKRWYEKKTWYGSGKCKGGIPVRTRTYIVHVCVRRTESSLLGKCSNRLFSFHPTTFCVYNQY